MMRLIKMKSLWLVYDSAKKLYYKHTPGGGITWHADIYDAKWYRQKGHARLASNRLHYLKTEIHEFKVELTPVDAHEEG